ncbi:MAG TPA: NAD(P)H-dependent oxidoreductase subunit E, partial [Spirochaetia bacterium]|nr:NAD(P)H-dependent oxidoreductase subunit E [Spirochaetia bacterium]
MAYKNFILVCGGTGCESSRADDIYKELIASAEALGVKDDVQIVKTGCFGFCEKGPIVKVLPSESFYVEVKPEDAREIIAEQVVKGREVTRLLYKDDRQKDRIKVEDIQFYQKQFRIVLRNCGVINPENIDEYIARDGYAALEKVLSSMKPDEVIEQLKVSGLRGRGGAGFPTWRKWMFSKGVQSDQKYVVCNADEGDPGAYMDRSTIEGDPHSVIEAMTICGYTVGSTKGFVYIRAEYPLAIERLKIALKQAREYGLLGDDILGTGFSFDIEIRLGAGAFVCGEETALLQSIEGNRGMPIPRPPFPAVKGLWGKPTIINNVETWANIPVIITKGA